MDIKNTNGLAIPCKSYLKKLSRELRNNSTKTEIILWNYLKSKKLGYQFNRQKPLLDYIVDFYCPQLKLVIEIDGSTHDNAEAKEKDIIRQKRLEDFGITFLRFNDDDIKNYIDGVVSEITEILLVLSRAVLKQNPPSPPPAGGGSLFGQVFGCFDKNFVYIDNGIPPPLGFPLLKGD